MALKDILVSVDGGKGARARLDFAVDLAAAHGAQLTAIHVSHLPVVPGFVASQVPKIIRDMQDETLRGEVAAVEAAVRAASRPGVEIAFRPVRGDVLDVTVAHGRYFDVTVVGQDMDSDERAIAGTQGLPEAVVLESGRPVLIVPAFGQFAGHGERVLVAWNGSREAARAVADAMPILVKAKQVMVLSANPEGAGRRLPGADIALHLARHGVKAEAATARADDVGIGDLLLSRAADMSADMIVMGAYGHSRMREVVLGGATRSLLATMTVPVFMAH